MDGWMDIIAISNCTAGRVSHSHLSSPLTSFFAAVVATDFCSSQLGSVFFCPHFMAQAVTPVIDHVNNC